MQRLLEQMVREMRSCRATVWAAFLGIRIRRLSEESRIDLLTDIEEGTRPTYDDEMEPTKVEAVILDMSGEAAYRLVEPPR